MNSIFQEFYRSSQCWIIKQTKKNNSQCIQNAHNYLYKSLHLNERNIQSFTYASSIHDIGGQYQYFFLSKAIRTIYRKLENAVYCIRSKMSFD